MIYQVRVIYMINKIKNYIKELKEYNKYKLPLADKQLTIKHLEANISKYEKIDIAKRKSIRVAFVDDEGYDLDQIKKAGYVDSHVINNYNKMSDFEQYDVIFCDINGVAKEFDPENQGAGLAKEIKNCYPEKMVNIFSSRKQNLKITSYTKYVDNIIPKNSSPSTIVNIIDEYINNKYDPIAYWINKEKYMRNEKISNNVIGIVEHYYVLSILNDRDLIDDVLLKYRKKFPIEDSIEVIEEMGKEISKIYFCR